ncbi:MAG: hypothetical protein ABIZ04_04590, partial [Opitutus sp.]
EVAPKTSTATLPDGTVKTFSSDAPKPSTATLPDGTVKTFAPVSTVNKVTNAAGEEVSIQKTKANAPTRVTPIQINAAGDEVQTAKTSSIPFTKATQVSSDGTGAGAVSAAAEAAAQQAAANQQANAAALTQAAAAVAAIPAPQPLPIEELGSQITGFGNILIQNQQVQAQQIDALSKQIASLIVSAAAAKTGNFKSERAINENMQS